MNTSRLLILIVLASALLAAQGLFFDFGDAPDPPYPSLIRLDDPANPGGPALVALGPSGELVSQVILGACVTTENNAQLVDQDTCDDATFVLDLASDVMLVSIQRSDSSASEPYWFNFLIDINQDGVWSPDTPEWLVRNCEISNPGLRYENIVCPTVPFDGGIFTDADQPWIRMMVSDLPAPAGGWDGSAFFAPGEARGEVEDHLPQPSPTPPPPPDEYFDFGDAPDPDFPTFMASQGPYAPEVLPSLVLGWDISDELSPRVIDDDTWDDGLVGDPDFDARRVTFQVNPIGLGWSPRPMYINLVVDLNEDGTWEDVGPDEPEEWIVRNCPVPDNVQVGGGLVTCDMDIDAGSPLPISILKRISAWIQRLAGNPVFDYEVWMRAMLTEWQVPGPNWAGELPAGFAITWGEIEDYFGFSIPEDIPTPTPPGDQPPPPPPTATPASPTVVPPSRTPTVVTGTATTSATPGTATASPTPSETPSVSATVTASATPAPPSATPEDATPDTETPTPSATITPTPSDTATSTPTPTATTGITRRSGEKDFGDAPRSYPTFPDQYGPYIPLDRDGNLILGRGISSEASPLVVDQDPQDDGLLWLNPSTGQAAFWVQPIGAWTANFGAYNPTYINVVIDLDDSGDWTTDEWVVRNCPVPIGIQGNLATFADLFDPDYQPDYHNGGVVNCDLQLSPERLADADQRSPLEIARDAVMRLLRPGSVSDAEHPHWVRVLLGNVPIDGFWRGHDPSDRNRPSPSTILSFGEVEDYFGWNDPPDDPPPIPYRFPTRTPTLTPRPTDPPPPTGTPTATEIPTEVLTPTPSRTPTPVPITGTVVDGQQVACRWGPSLTFITRFTLGPASIIHLLGLNSGWAYAEVSNPPENPSKCWVFLGDSIVVDGDTSTLAFVQYDVNLPLWTAGNPPPDNVKPSRDGSSVTVSWDAVALQTDPNLSPDFLKYHVVLRYCRGGQMVEVELETNSTKVTINDFSDNCNEQSTATVRVRHNRGFSEPVKINIP